MCSATGQPSAWKIHIASHSTECTVRTKTLINSAEFRPCRAPPPVKQEAELVPAFRFAARAAGGRRRVAQHRDPHCDKFCRTRYAAPGTVPGLPRGPCDLAPCGGSVRSAGLLRPGSEHAPTPARASLTRAVAPHGPPPPSLAPLPGSQGRQDGESAPPATLPSFNMHQRACADGTQVSMPVMFGKERAHAEHHRLRSIQSQSGGFRSASTQGTLACPGIYLFLWGPQTKRDKTSICWFMTNLVRLAARDARAAEASVNSGCMSDHGVTRAVLSNCTDGWCWSLQPKPGNVSPTGFRRSSTCGNILC